MALADSHPVQRATLIFLKFLLAVSVVLFLASQFRWLDIVWANKAGYSYFFTNQSGTVFIFGPEQLRIGNLNQYRSGDYDNDDVPDLQRRLHYLDSLSPGVVSGPGFKGWGFFPPPSKVLFLGLYINHLYGLFFTVGSYTFARFYVRRRLRAN